MSGSVNDYMTRLEQQLRQRGIADPRILAEAREHLVDVIEEGRGRGLPAADAEHEAFERFGTPEIVAAHVLEERERMKTGAAGAFAAIRRGKWWILGPAIMAAVITGVSVQFQSPRYRSEATILVVPQRVSGDYVRSSVTVKTGDRLRSITQQVTSRTRLQRIIEDFDLYPERRKTDSMQDIADDMSRAINIEILHDDLFRVAFTSDNPRTAQRVAERLATFYIDESLKDRTNLAEGASEFLDTQIADVRRQIIELEDSLNKADASNGDRPISQADVIPYDILKENYKALLLKRADARISANLERRQIGEQFRILDPARLPEQPVGPNRLRVAAMGALVGLAVGLVLVVLRRSSNTRPPALAEA